MANTRISDLTASASNLAASDLVPVVQTPGVGPVKMTGTQIKTGIIGAGSVSIASGKTFTASNTLTLAGTDGSSVAFGTGGTVLYNGGALGTPSSGTLTNATGLPVGGISATGTPSASTYLRGDGSWQSVSASPGGSNTQVQFNNSGAFGGSANFTFDSTNAALTVGGATVTTSSPVLNLTQTWNGTNSTLLYGAKINISTTPNTTSDYSSPLFAVQINSNNAMVVGATSGVNGGYAFLDLRVNSSSPSYSSATISDNGTVTGLGFGRTTLSLASTSLIHLGGGATSFRLAATTSFGWSTSPADTASDLQLTRANTATLQLGAADTTGTTAPTAQFLRVQSWSSSTNNNQTGADFTIQGSRGTGTGAGGSIIFQVAPAGSSGTAQNAYSTALTIAPGGIATATGTSSPAFVANNTTGSSKAAAITAGAGASVFLFDDTGIFGIYSNLKSRIIGTQPNSSATGQMIITTSSRAIVGSGGAFAFDSTSDPANNTPDVFLNRDGAPNTLALRNGTNAQRFNVYNTYTSSTNYETFKVDWITTANTCLIGTEKGSGGGNARALALQTDGTTRLTIETNGDLTIADAENIIVGSTTGTKIGTATSQKIGFWNATPIVQPTTGVAEAAFVENSGGTAVNVDSTFGGYTLQQVVKALQNAGLLA